MTDEDRDVMLFVHTSALSALFVAGQIEHFARAGFDTHYAASWDPDDDAPDVGCPVWNLPLARRPAPLRDARALLAAVRLMRRLRPSVVHAGTPKAALIATTAAWLTRRPVRIDAVHGLRYETTTGLTRRVLRTLERATSRAATHVVADGASLRQVLVDDLGVRPSKVHVLGPGSSNGVDLERFGPAADHRAARDELGIDVDAPVLGFVGRLTHDKGIDDLAAVHHDLLATRRVQLLLVGDFEADDPVTAQTRHHIEHHPDVVRIPWTDHPERVYPAMNLLVFPSHREGLPNVPLEAQAAGVPVVGYAATGTVDAVADPADLVPIGDTAALARAIDALLDDPQELAERGRVARAWVTAFDRTAVWDARADFVRRCLSESRRTA